MALHIVREWRELKHGSDTTYWCASHKFLWPFTFSPANHRYEAIFNFGDSLSDTGNRIRTGQPTLVGELPYGITFGKHSGRSSDGRLVIDFITEELGLKYLPPYLELKQGPYVKTGVNFAVAGATALDLSVLQDKMNPFPLKLYIFSNQSLSVQLSWFKDWASKCTTSQSDCKEYFKKSLFVVGIGGNDYNCPIISEVKAEQVETLVPPVTERIAKAIVELINEAGAVNFLVPGAMVPSCNMGKDKPPFRSHNKALQQTLEKVRKAHPHVNITYADYFGAGMVFYRHPRRYGFANGTRDPCCTPLYMCGSPKSKACPDPSEFVCWDGSHLTESAYKIMADGLMHGNFTSSSLHNKGPFL